MSLHLTVVTPEGEAFNEDVQTVVLPGTEGEFGVLAGHEPFLTALQVGPMRIERPSGPTLHAVLGRGFAGVQLDNVTVLVSTCEFAHDIDRSRAEVARDRALAQLKGMRASEEGEAAYQELQEAYSRAIARIATSEKFKT
jgi:F-type H+-transporting ATPase subunit epsilon